MSRWPRVRAGRIGRSDLNVVCLIASRRVMADCGSICVFVEVQCVVQDVVEDSGAVLERRHRLDVNCDDKTSRGEAVDDDLPLTAGYCSYCRIALTCHCPGSRKLSSPNSIITDVVDGGGGGGGLMRSRLRVVSELNNY